MTTAPHWAVRHTHLLWTPRKVHFHGENVAEKVHKSPTRWNDTSARGYIHPSGCYSYKMAVKLFWKKEAQGQTVALRALWNVFKQCESAVWVHPAKEQAEKKDKFMPVWEARKCKLKKKKTSIISQLWRLYRFQEERRNFHNFQGCCVNLRCFAVWNMSVSVLSHMLMFPICLGKSPLHRGALVYLTAGGRSRDWWAPVKRTYCSTEHKWDYGRFHPPAVCVC